MMHKELIGAWRRRTIRFASVFALAAGLMVVAPASPAEANYLVGITGNGGSTCASGLNMMDPLDSSVHYRKSSLRSNVSTEVSWVMTNRIAPTDLSAWSTSSNEDVTFYDAYYTTTCGKNWWQPSTGGLAGLATCRYKSGSKCTRHYVRISNTYADSTSTTNRRKLVCHETAHVIGINHNTHSSSLNSCVRDPASSGTTGFSSHELNDMINWQW